MKNTNYLENDRAWAKKTSFTFNNNMHHVYQNFDMIYFHQMIIQLLRVQIQQSLDTNEFFV